jgi:hypothetical protein
VRQAARGRGQARGRGAAAGRAPAPAKPRGFEARRIGVPRSVQVETGRGASPVMAAGERARGGGRPVAVAGTPVEAVREDWVVEDRWWTGKPLRRRYFELVLADGRNVVVFHELPDGAWFTQRA